MKQRLYTILLVLLMLLCSYTGSLLASDQDNATSGSGETGNAVEGKGFYLAKHYAWKVSLFVGKTDQATTSSDLRKEFYYIGKPIVLKPNNYVWPDNTTLKAMTKLDIMNNTPNGENILPYPPPQNPPPPPIVSGGDIERVKAYFGDTATLEYCLIKLAESKGVTIPQLFTGLTFTVAGETCFYDQKTI